jgi:AcrR family transcriptional regulator
MTQSVKRDPMAYDGSLVERWTPERRRQQTRDVLVDAAAQVFARRGFEGASLEEVAETAGYSRGTIYKTFGGKEELFLAVNQRFNERAVAFFGELVDEHGLKMDAASMPELAAQWRNLFFHDADFFALGLEFQLYVQRHPEVRPKVTEYARRNVEMIAQFIEEQAVASGVELPYAPDLLARILLAASDGFQQSARFDPDAPDLVGPFLDLYIRALTAPPGDTSSTTDSAPSGEKVASAPKLGS